MLRHEAGRNIPFGMNAEEAVKQTASQVALIPAEVKRIVVPVGSGMTLCGIMNGLYQHDWDLPVVGVSVGANPERRLCTFMPFGWQQQVQISASRH